jgi:hypothetical protein
LASVKNNNINKQKKTEAGSPQILKLWFFWNSPSLFWNSFGFFWFFWNYLVFFGIFGILVFEEGGSHRISTERQREPDTHRKTQGIVSRGEAEVIKFFSEAAK